MLLCSGNSTKTLLVSAAVHLMGVVLSAMELNGKALVEVSMLNTRMAREAVRAVLRTAHLLIVRRQTMVEDCTLSSKVLGASLIIRGSQFATARSVSIAKVQ